MSLVTPTTQELAESIVSQLESSFAQSLPLLPKSFTRVLAKTLAGVFIILYKYSGWVSLQLFVQTASFDETTINGQRVRPLVLWGRLIGEGDPEPATRAELVVTVTVLNQTGSLAAGAQLVRSDTGVIYTTVAAVPLNAATVPVTVIAASDQAGGDGSGSIGNLQVGDELEFANPLPNVARVAVVASQTVQGADAETADAYRARVVQRFQRQPQGGAYADYQQWAEEAPGIIHAYPYAGGPGQVHVYVEATVESSGSANGIPTLAQRNAARDLINLDVDGLATRRPVGTAVTVFPIRRTEFDVEVVALDVDDPVTVQASINEGVDEFFRSREPFIVGLSSLPRLDRITLAAVSGVVDGIAAAAGGSVASVRMREAGSLLVARSLGDGEKAKSGTVSYLST